MRINVEGEALKLLQDFIKYSNFDPESIADAMSYDLDGFQLFEIFKTLD